MAYQPVPVTFQSGTLIIPMDSTYQNSGMFKSFGLIFRLLYENIINTSLTYKPIYIYWSIDSNKTSFANVDFTATTKGYNTVLASGLHQYSGGPFVIQSDDLNYVKTIIASWNSNNSPVVNIHEFLNSATINTIAKIMRPPRISVEYVNFNIVSAYLSAAGLPDFYALSGAYTAAPAWNINSVSVFTSDDINNGAFFGGSAQLKCRQLAYDIFISPHTGEDIWTDNINTIPNLDEFIRFGGILHSMCHSIEAIENNSLFLTTTGIPTQNKGKLFLQNTQSLTNPLLQAVLTTSPQVLPGGSVQTWRNSLTNYKPLTSIFAYFTDNNIQYDFLIAGKYQGSIINQSAKGAGVIVYEGGHSYDTVVPYTSNPENMYTKFVLNDVLLSVVKPNFELSINPNVITADGNPKNLSFDMKNTGGSQAKNSSISITLLPNMNPSNYNITPTTITGSLITGYILSWSNITVDGGNSITFSVNNYIPISPGEYLISYSATFSDEMFATNQNPYSMNVCSSLAILPANSPFLLIQKQVNGGDNVSIKSGDNVTFSFNVTNYGDQPGYNIEIVDPLLFDYFNFNLADIIPAPISIDTTNKKIIFPTGLGGLSIPSSPGPGNTLTITVNATHKGISFVPPTEISNIAHVNYYNFYPGDLNPSKISPDSDIALVKIVIPDISVIKTVNKFSSSIGDVLKYKINITNIGNTPITQINLTDLIPDGSSYILGSLNATANNFNPTGTITAQYISTVPQRINVIIDGSLNPAPLDPDTPLTSIDIEFDIIINSITQNPITNKAATNYIYSIGSQGSDTDVKDSNIVQTNIASLQIIKTSPQYTNLGQNLTYTISLTNNGLVPLTNVQIIDTIPSQASYISSSGATLISQVGQVITLQVNSMPINDVETINITVNVNDLPPSPYNITNLVSAIYSVDGEEKPPITSTSVSTVVDGRINVIKSTVGDIIYAKVGDTITYTVDITNIGNVSLNITNLNDAIQPNGYTNSDITNIPLNISLQPNESTTLTYDVNILDLPPGKKLNNTAIVDFNYLAGQNIVTGSSQDIFSLNVEKISVNLIKSANKSFIEPGEEITYTFIIDNQSSIPITDLYLYDPLPFNTTFVPGSFSLDPTKNPTISPGVLISSIATNSQVIASFKVKVNSNLTTTVNISDVGYMTYNFQLDPNGSSISVGPVNSNTVNTQVEIPQVEILKYQSTNYAEVGDIINYTLTIQNTGTINAYNLEVTDLLPIELQFIPSSLIVTPQQVGDIVVGTDLNSIKFNILRNNPNVATIKFDAMVIDRPTSGKIYNLAKVNFNYSLDPLLPPTLSKNNILSNEVNITIQEISVELLKTADSSFVEVGDDLTYTIQITNNSTVSVDIKFIDTIPLSTVYVDGSFNIINSTTTIINNTSPNSILIDADVLSMLPQTTVIFSYKIKVLSLVSPPQMTNFASITPIYSLFQGGPLLQGDTVDDKITTDVVFVKLDAIKSVEESIATIDDILHYTILVINNGNIDAKNVLLTDNIPMNTEFVKDSLKIDNISEDGNIEEGIELGDIAPSQIITIEFQLKIISIPKPPEEKKIKNRALILFEVELDGQLEMRDPVYSNITETKLVNVELIAIKNTDKKEANVGDTLTYTVVVTNNGDIAIDNILFSDIIPPGTVLVGTQPISNVDLGIIEPGESKTVTFVVKVISQICPPKLTNKANIAGSYIVEKQRSIDIESNEVVSYVNVKPFKQFSIDTLLKIPPQKPKAEDILETISNLEIISTYLIRTPIISSYEGQVLTGWKVIVSGIIIEKVVYIADEPTQSVHAAEFEIPFCSFIILPKDYKYCKDISIKGTIENTCFNLGEDGRTISKTIILMIQGRTES